MSTTTITEEKTPLPQLIKGSSTYNLIIPQSVENKIRYLIRKFPSTEWSGVLFYTHTGSFENNDLTITCQDFYPMDLGTAGWTEFKMTEEVTSYMADNIDLFDCETGLIHSHHHLGAFFSSQDNLMLQQEGNDTNCFVSLVVDTKGTYVARITRKKKTKAEITIRNQGSSYEFFGEGTKELSSDNTETIKTIDKEVIEYFDLQVERHEVPNTLEYLDARFEEIERKKNSNKCIPNDRLNIPNEPNLFNQDLFKVYNNADNSSEYIPDPKKIHKAVVSMITCNLILNPDKFDLKQWITRHMVNVYRKIFGENSDTEERLKGASPFNEWKDFITDFIINHFDEENEPGILSEDYDYFKGSIAEAMLEELYEYEGLNPYIQQYCEALECYLDIPPM